jgi:hypothetical protein
MVFLAFSDQSGLYKAITLFEIGVIVHTVPDASALVEGRGGNVVALALA